MEPVAIDCVVCGTDMTEIYHYPVRNFCECKTRICQSCRYRIKRCPTCRHDTIDTTVDETFLEQAVMAVKGRQCEGCGRFVRSRHTVKHGKECAGLLALRLRETMDDCLQKEVEYRHMLQENERLTIKMHEMGYQLHFLRDYYDRTTMPHPPPPPLPLDQDLDPPTIQTIPSEDEDEEESDMEIELETHHLPPLPTLIPTAAGDTQGE